MDSRRQIRIAAIDPSRVMPFAAAKFTLLALVFGLVALLSDSFAKALESAGFELWYLIFSPLVGAGLGYSSVLTYNLTAKWFGGIDLIMMDVEEAERETTRRKLSEVLPDIDDEVRTSWYVVSSAGRRGPYSRQQLDEYIREGGIHQGTELNRVKVNERTREQISSVTQLACDYRELETIFGL